jgi:hypothetical protein
VDYIHRDIGPHAVTATGCHHRMYFVAWHCRVPDERVIPEVNLLSTPSYCLKPTGTVNLELLTGECSFG